MKERFTKTVVNKQKTFAITVYCDEAADLKVGIEIIDPHAIVDTSWSPEDLQKIIDMLVEAKEGLEAG